ncbi:unnamed protein product [Auanema sp. JU1783]|nr:unnamed protein product [Auanema sp. JU1783]
MDGTLGDKRNSLTDGLNALSRGKRLRIVNYDEEIAKLNKESLETSNTLVILCEEAKERGLETLAALEDQDEQLDNIENTMSKISTDMVRVRRDIRKTDQSCLCYPFYSSIEWFRKKFNLPCLFGESHTDTSSYKGTPLSDNGFRHSYSQRNTSRKIKKKEDDENSLNSIEEEIEKNVFQVEAALESMRHVAVDIDVQLRIQEPKLDRIHHMAENNDTTMTGAQQKMKKLLQS